MTATGRPVGIITYQAGHRKTLNVTLKLLIARRRVVWFAFPFVKRARPDDGRYPDRPSQLLDFDPEEFCRRYGIDYRRVHWDDPKALGADDTESPRYYLHCTAKIVPARFTKEHVILNVHPGLLPENRGVDAFKRAIITGAPLGITLHVIDEAIDRGTVLKRVPIPIFESDTLADVCERAYAMECDLLASFDRYVGQSIDEQPVGDQYPVSHERIPREADCRLAAIFEEHKAKWTEQLA